MKSIAFVLLICVVVGDTKPFFKKRMCCNSGVALRRRIVYRPVVRPAWTVGYFPRPWTGLALGNGIVFDSGFGFGNGIGCGNSVAIGNGFGFGNGIDLGPRWTSRPELIGAGVGPILPTFIGAGCGNQISAGVSGLAQESAQSSSATQMNNIGEQHNEITSINQQESSESHDVGSYGAAGSAGTVSAGGAVGAAAAVSAAGAAGVGVNAGAGAGAGVGAAVGAGAAGIGDYYQAGAGAAGAHLSVGSQGLM